MQRIEFCFFDAGGGHRAAATALEMSIKAQGRPWDVRLMNLQELLDELDILKKYAGIRIEDYYFGQRTVDEGAAVRNPLVSFCDSAHVGAALEGNTAGHGCVIRAALQSRVV